MVKNLQDCSTKSPVARDSPCPNTHIPKDLPKTLLSAVLQLARPAHNNQQIISPLKELCTPGCLHVQLKFCKQK